MLGISGLSRGEHLRHPESSARGQASTLDGEDNFPIIVDTSESAWRKAIETLKRNHRELQDEVTAMPDSRLTESVPGKDYDIYFMLHGAVQHALYHAGQMAILKKVLT